MSLINSVNTVPVFIYKKVFIDIILITELTFALWSGAFLEHSVASKTTADGLMVRLLGDIVSGIRWHHS